MLDLHAYVAVDQRDEAIRLLDSMAGIGHATALPASSDGTVHPIAEVEPSVAEDVMEALEALGIPPGDIGLARRSWIQPAGAVVAPESVLMWADVLGAARMESRVVGRYVGLMFVADIIAGYGVVIDNPILIVGAGREPGPRPTHRRERRARDWTMEPDQTRSGDADRRPRPRHRGRVRRRGAA
jgi:hypothetical protein